MRPRHVTIPHLSQYGRQFLARFILVMAALPPLTGLQAQTDSDAVDPHVERLYSEAKAAEAQGDLASAVDQYESILQIAPRLGAAYNNLGALYVKQREYRKAADVLEKGLKVDPAMPSASALLGMALFEMGQYADARPPLESALRA